MFDFIMKQVLGMQWLNEYVWSFLKEVFNANSSSPIWSSIHFFLYDMIKISILLVVLIFMITYIQSYFPPEKTKRILTGYNKLSGAIIAALLGTVTPFCSCSSIPIFIGFTRAGMPLGTTFSFLISSPMVDVASMLMLMSFFGAKFAIAYVILGLILAIAGGLFINSLQMEKYLKKYDNPIKKFYSESEYFNQVQRLNYAYNDTRIIVRNVFPYVLAGVAIGSVLHNWIPEEWILNTLGSQNIFGVIIATLIGVPVYADIFGTLPIAEALYMAGVPVGTILALMMSVTTLSLPSLIMLSEVLHKRLLFTFIGVVVYGIVVIGYTFNIIW
ncbi:MAG: permease [Phascolarctobacterium sp.]|nr:permease [Phascolarctobacterium sp.]